MITDKVAGFPADDDRIDSLQMVIFEREVRAALETALTSIPGTGGQQ